MRYRCFDCGENLGIEIPWDADTSERTEACACGTRVGRGHVTCPQCAGRVEVRLPHWHRPCDLFDQSCPLCGARLLSLCIC
jgi:DNA-directed RNA polymerase subunit RPC12/RpoP